MGQLIEKDRFDQFQRDRNLLLHYNDTEVAQKMGMNKSNYSHYVHGRKTITSSFLKKFYLAFGEELREISERAAHIVKEPDTAYGLLQHPPGPVDRQQERYDMLEKKVERVMESLQMISRELELLEKKIDYLMENRSNKIETLLTLLIAQIQDKIDPAPQTPGLQK